MTSQLTEIALQMLGTIERMELIIPEITDTIRKALEEKSALAAEPDPSCDGEVAELVEALRHCSDGAGACGDEGAAWVTARAADLLERLAPVPQPVPGRPSDEELLEMWYGSDWFNNGPTPRGFISTARAVLARWGQP